MENKIYLIKFSLISFLFSIVVIVTHLLPYTDLLFVKKGQNPAPNNPLNKNPEERDS